MYPWLVLDMIIFITLNILLIRHIGPTSEMFALLTPFKLVLFGLAVYRGANIISNEFVTKPLREYFVIEKEINGKFVEEPREIGLRGFIGSLIYCPSCTGVWFSLIIVYSYILWPNYASIIVVLLAFSGLERFFAYTFGRIKNR